MESDTTTQPRILGLTSFLRSSRPRSQVSPTTEAPPSHPGLPLPPTALTQLAYSVGAPQQGPSAAGHRRRPVASLQSAPQTTNVPSGNNSGNVSFTQMLRRRRSANGNGNGLPQQQSTINVAQSSANPPPVASSISHTTPHRIRLVPHLENSRSLHFEPITRECREGTPAIRIGRFTDRSGMAANSNSLQGKIAFKSKVVSRGHAEIWCEANGKFWIKDTSSSSGTFLNHTRLSHAGVESRAFQLKDGDILQLGVDYQGGTEEIYRCVKIRVEIGREWQAQPNAFNTTALAQLRQLSNLVPPPAAAGGASVGKVKTDLKSKASVSDCCICLFPVTVCQALFIAPCSHSFHYKCIRGTLLDHHPGFSCPLCRSFHNLEADVEVELPDDAAGEQWEEPPEDVILAPTTNMNTASMANLIEEVDVLPATSVPTSNANQTMLDDVDPGVESGVENIIVQGINAGVSGPGLRRGSGPMRSVEDDLPFQTAAEDNGGRHLLPTRPRDSGFRNSRRTTVHIPDQGQAQGQSLPLPDADSDGPMSGALAGVDTDMDLDEPVGMPHRTRAPNARRSIYAAGNGSGVQSAGSGSGSSSNLPGHAHEYPPSSSFGAFDVHVQSQPADHLANGGSTASGVNGSRRVPVPAHLYAEAAEMGVLPTPAVEEYMSGGEATAEGNITIAGTKRKR